MPDGLSQKSVDKIYDYFKTFKNIMYLPHDYRPQSYTTAVRNSNYETMAKKRREMTDTELQIANLMIEAFNDGVEYERVNEPEIIY